MIHAQHVLDGDVLADTDHEGNAGIHGFDDGVRRKGAGHEDDRDVGFGLADCLSDSVKHRRPAGFLSAASGGYASHNLRAVLHHLLGMKRAFAAGDALHEQAGVFIDKYAHEPVAFGAAATLTTSCAAACMVSAATRPASCKIARPSSWLVPTRRTTIGT